MRQFNARHQPSPLPPPSLSIRERFFYENEGGRDFTSHPSRDRIENNNFAILKFFVHVFLPLQLLVEWKCANSTDRLMEVVGMRSIKKLKLEQNSASFGITLLLDEEREFLSKASKISGRE